MNNKVEAYKTNNKSFVRRLFIDLIIVMTVSQLTGTLVGIIDTYCTSLYLGDNGLSALGLTAPLVQIISMIAMIFAVGGELVITKLLAKGEKKTANKHLTSNTCFLFILGIILTVILFFTAAPISKLLSFNKASENVIKITSQYLKGLVIGIPFILLDSYLSAVVYLDNDKSRMTISIIVIFIVNITLDFIFANYFANKAFGIGLASSIAYLCSTIVLLTHFLSKKTSFKLDIKSFRFNHIKQSFKLGAVIGVTDIVIFIRLYIVNLIMLTVGNMSKIPGITGDAIIASSGIEGAVTSMFDLGLGGLLETILMLGGVFYEEEDEKSLNELLFDVIKFTLIVGAILSIVYFFTAPYIAPLYSKDQIIIEQATYSMRANSVAIIIFSLSTSLLTFLQASKRNIYAHISTTLQSLILPIIFMSVLGFTIGVKGIWIGFPLSFIVYFIIHLTYAFVKGKKIKVDFRTLFFLPKTFGYKDNQVYEKYIYSINDVFNLEDDVLNFCNRFKIDSKRKENLANATEELGKLIVLSGFIKDNKKKPYASIKVLYKPSNKSLIIRSRDNCNKFDITEKIEEIKQGNRLDPALNSALKILINISKDIDYSRVFNTNNVIIKI